MGALLALAAGCSNGGGQEASRSEIYEGPVWTLAETPDYSVSASTDEPSYILDLAQGGYFLANGSAVVATFNSRHLVYFDSLGAAIAVAGGSGGGPGEFSEPFGSIYGSGDGISVWELTARRLSHFSAEGIYHGGATLSGVTFAQRPIGYISGAGLVTVGAPPPGAQRSIEIWSEEGELTAQIQGAIQPPSAAVSFRAPRSPEMVAAGLIPPGGDITRNTSIPCVATSGEVVIGSQIYSMDALQGTVTRYSVDGESSIVYQARERQYVTEQFYAAVRRRVTESAILSEAPSDTIEAALQRTLAVGTPVPAWTRMIADPSGRLWLGIYACTDDGESDPTYEVIDTQGRALGRISVPRGRSILAVRGDRLLINRRDDLDVEHVELYRIHQDGPGTP